MQWNDHGCHPMRRTEAGFTLVELLSAIAIVCFAGLWLLGSYQASWQLAEVAEQQAIATDDLKDMMEKIKTTPFNRLTTDFPNGAVNGIVGPGTDKYLAIVGSSGGVYSLQGEQITVTHTPDTNADPRELKVQVTWTNRGRTYRQSASTIRTSRAS